MSVKKTMNVTLVINHFFNKQELSQHKNTVHEGRKDHKCNSCGNSFTHPQSLKKHIYSIQFMKDIKITNVFFMANHFHKKET